MVLFILFLPGCKNHSQIPVAQKGVLDLRRWDFEKKGSVSLKGQWEFYKNKMVPPQKLPKDSSLSPEFAGVPESWEIDPENKKTSGRGYGTYHLRILLPARAGRLGLKLLDVSTAFTLFADGIKRAESGTPGTTQKDSSPLFRPQAADLGIHKDKIDIVVHVSNFHHWQGGIWKPIRLGRLEDIQSDRERKLLLESFLLGSILIMGLYHLGLFCTRTACLSPLYFGLFCLMIGLRLMSTEERLIALLAPSMGFRADLLMGYLSFFFSVPFFALYICALFPKEISKYVVRTCLGAASLFSVFMILAPLPIMTYAVPLAQGLTLGVAGYGIWGAGKAVFNRRQGSVIFMAGFLLLNLTLVNDILHSRQLISTSLAVPWGTLFFIFSQAILLYRRFSQAFDTVEIQLLELTRSNCAYQKELKTRIRIQSELKVSEAQYRELIENSADGICIVVDDKICYANPRFLALTGMERADIGRESFLRYIDPNDRAKIIARYGKEVVPEKIHGNFPVRGRDRDNRLYYLELNATSVDWKKQKAILTFVRDVTEQTKTRELLFQSEKILSVGGLAAGMAHEINNPLAGMVLNAQLIKQRLSDQNPPNLKTAEEFGIELENIHKYAEKRGLFRFIDHICSAGQNATEIVDNMLSFARKSVSLKKSEILPQIVDKALALIETDFQLNKKYDFREIRINKDYAPDIGKVRCEETKIRQVLLNLFKNAAQAMGPTGGKISRPMIDIRLFQSKGMACLSIKDNGPGMNDGIRKRIFEPFFTTKAGDKGTGLGLSISYFIITEDHGGQMDVRSAPGQGTEFIIRLPLAQSAMVALPESTMSSGSRPGF